MTGWNFQGLSDLEETVITSCINAMSSLVRPDLMSKPTLYQLLSDAVPYLLHPNLWIRQATVGKMDTVTRKYLQQTVTEVLKSSDSIINSSVKCTWQHNSKLLKPNG